MAFKKSLPEGYLFGPRGVIFQNFESVKKNLKALDKAHLFSTGSCSSTGTGVTTDTKLDTQRYLFGPLLGTLDALFRNGSRTAVFSTIK